MATSLLPVLSCAELAEELTQSLAILQAEIYDLPVEQRSLRAVFDRSWRLLTPPEQTLLAQLSIWAGTFHRKAAQTIAAASRPLLLRLIHQSLVNSTPEGRYALHPIVRAFALEKLAQTPAQADAVRIRYAHFYLDWLAQKEPALKGSALATVTAQIYTELDNLRLAWRWATTYRLASPLLAAMHALFLFYDFQELYSEAIDQAESALQPLLADEPTHSQPAETLLALLIGRLQCYWGCFTIRLGCRAEAEQSFAASLTRLRPIEDSFATAFCLSAWGTVSRGRDIQHAKALLSEAERQLATITNGWLNAWVYLCCGEVNYLLGDYPAALTQYTKAYQIAEQIDCAWGLVTSRRLLSQLYTAIGDYPGAEAHARACIVYAHGQNMKIVWVQTGIYLAEALRRQGRFVEARRWYDESRQEAEALHHQFLIAQAIWGQGSLAEQCGEYATAQALFTESRRTGHPNLWAQLLPTLGWALIGLGAWADAQRYFEQILSETQTCQFPPVMLDAQVGLAYLQILRAIQAGQAWPAAYSQVVHAVCRHPATHAETRHRIRKVSDELGRRQKESLPA